MENKTKLNIIGAIFLIWGIAAIIDNILDMERGIAPLLWMSYISLIILAIGILKKDSSLIASQIVLLGVPYLIWNSDFFYHLFTGKSLLGITDYFFEIGHLLPIEKAISIQHIFNIPLSLWAIYLIGLKRKDFWKISIFQIIIIFIISRLTTNYEDNVNCVFRSCGNITIGMPHILEWFISYIAMIAITSWLLIKIFYKKIKEKSKK